MFWSDMDTKLTAGYYLAPNSQDNHFSKMCGGKPCIVLARGLAPEWQRLITVKELMHVFDSGLQLVGSASDFVALLSEFEVPQLERSQPMESEVRSLYMALSLFCPEAQRQHLQRERDKGATTDVEIAKKLELPEAHVPYLFMPTYKEIISHILSTSGQIPS